MGICSGTGAHCQQTVNTDHILLKQQGDDEMLRPVVGNHIEMYPAGDKMSIFNRITGKTYVVGANESKVIGLFDGKRTVEEISTASGIYSVEEITKLVEALSMIGLFKAEKRKQNWFKIKLPVFNPNKIFRQESIITKIQFFVIAYGWLFLLPSGLAVNSFGFFGLVPENGSADEIVNEFMHMGVADWIIITLFSLVCLAVHELGHTVAARHYGVNVPEIGFMLYFLVPCAYTNISGINLLESRKKRIVVLLSGIFANLGIIGVLYIFLAHADVHTAAILLAVIAANAFTVFTNGMVFIKHDGYYIAEVLFDEPMLRENALAHLKKTIMNKNGRADSSSNLTHTVYIMYSVLSVLYIPILIAGTLISAFMPF